MPVNADREHMRLALRLARRGYGRTSPNPMVGAVVVRGREIIGRGWHRGAGKPHAEIEAIRSAAKAKRPLAGSTLYVTLEPCCTHGRTPPCTDAILANGVRRLVVAAVDPNPAHAGRGLSLLAKAGVEVTTGVLEREASELNAAFNHWIVRGTPHVLLKAAMTLDGKIATRTGDSRWITGPAARAYGMRLREGADAILVGVRTVLADDPQLTVRSRRRTKPIRRVILDSKASTPLQAKVVRDEFARSTTVVVTPRSSAARRRSLAERVDVLVAPSAHGRVNLAWLMDRLGQENVTSLLVEGGGEVHAAFIEARLAQRIAFFYGPCLLGGTEDRPAVAGEGARDWRSIVGLTDVKWRHVGEDLLLLARIGGPKPGG